MTIDVRTLAIALALLVSAPIAAQTKNPPADQAKDKNQRLERAKERCKLTLTGVLAGSGCVGQEPAKTARSRQASTAPHHHLPQFSFSWHFPIGIYNSIASSGSSGLAITEEEGVMSFFTVVVLAAVLATVVALVSGISSMATDHQVGHLDSAHWMARRVEFQAVAFLLVLLAIYVTS